MSRRLGWIAIALLLGVCGVALVAYGNPVSHPSLSERTRAVAQQLRCPVCQGESVADSPSGLARAMRGIIRQRLARGESTGSIKAYFVAKYGDWILLSPPTSGIGTFAWLAPPLLLLGGFLLLAVMVASWRRRFRPVASNRRTDYLERIQAELAADSGTE